MSNMSYCRWFNTEKDLTDCHKNLSFNSIEEVSDMELNAMQKMLVRIQEMAQESEQRDYLEIIENQIEERKSDGNWNPW